MLIFLIVVCNIILLNDFILMFTVGLLFCCKSFFIYFDLAPLCKITLTLYIRLRFVFTLHYFKHLNVASAAYSREQAHMLQNLVITSITLFRCLCFRKYFSVNFEDVIVSDVFFSNTFLKMS